LESECPGRSRSPSGGLSTDHTYDDTVVRTAERWKFRSRRLSHDIAGDSGLNVK
jgi:hypothetical protein